MQEAPQPRNLTESRSPSSRNPTNASHTNPKRAGQVQSPPHDSAVTGLPAGDRGGVSRQGPVASPRLGRGRPPRWRPGWGEPVKVRSPLRSYLAGDRQNSVASDRGTRERVGDHTRQTHATTDSSLPTSDSPAATSDSSAGARAPVRWRRRGAPGRPAWRSCGRGGDRGGKPRRCRRASESDPRRSRPSPRASCAGHWPDCG